MAHHNVSRLIVAESAPPNNGPVLAALTEGAADLLRFPGLLTIYHEQDPRYLSLRAQLDRAIETCVRLHELDEIVVVQSLGDTAHDMMREHLEEKLPSVRFTPCNFTAQKVAVEEVESWRTTAITCVDYRSPFDHTRRGIMSNVDTHLVCLPGAVKWFLESGILGRELFNWLLNRKQKVRLFQHEDCGAYGSELHEDELRERLEHLHAMREFVRIATNHGVTVTECGFIRLDGGILTV